MHVNAMLWYTVDRSFTYIVYVFYLHWQTTVFLPASTLKALWFLSHHVALESSYLKSWRLRAIPGLLLLICLNAIVVDHLGHATVSIVLSVRIMFHFFGWKPFIILFVSQPVHVKQGCVSNLPDLALCDPALSAKGIDFSLERCLTPLHDVEWLLNYYN